MRRGRALKLKDIWTSYLCNDRRAAETPGRVVTELNSVMEESDECSECRRYLGYLSHENTKGLQLNI